MKERGCKMFWKIENKCTWFNTGKAIFPQNSISFDIYDDESVLWHTLTRTGVVNTTRKSN